MLIKQDFYFHSLGANRPLHIRITDRGDAIALQPKSLGGNALTITTGMARTWSIILCIVIPVLVLLAGITVYLKRRYK